MAWRQTPLGVKKLFSSDIDAPLLSLLSNLTGESSGSPSCIVGGCSPEALHEGMAVELADLAHPPFQPKQCPPEAPAAGAHAEPRLTLRTAEQRNRSAQDSLHRCSTLNPKP